MINNPKQFDKETGSKQSLGESEVSNNQYQVEGIEATSVSLAGKSDDSSLFNIKKKDIQEGKENIRCDNCSCCNAQNHLCSACLKVIKDEGKAEVLKEWIGFLEGNYIAMHDDDMRRKVKELKAKLKSGDKT